MASVQFISSIDFDWKTHLLGAKTQTDFLVLMVQMENSIFNFVSPEKFITFQVLHTLVRRDELTNTRLTDIV